MKRIFAMVVLLALMAAAFALPSVEAVQAEVKRGNYVQAEDMMRQVIAGRPGSARAHYVYAEILAHNRHFAQAQQEARRAQQIAPDLGFTQPEEFRAFERLLETEQGAANPAPARPARLVSASAARSTGDPSGGVPGWAWLLVGLVFAGLLWSMIRPRSQGGTTPPAAGAANFGAPPYGPGPGSGPGPGAGYSPGYGTGYGPGYGPTAVAPAAGSGMLGTGLAAAGGVAAGMLAERMLDGRNAFGTASAPALAGSELAPAGYGLEPERNEAAGELEQRPIDFGSGDEWDGGVVDSGVDGGGGGDDSGSGSDGW